MFKHLKLEFKLLNEKDWKSVNSDHISFQTKYFPATLPPFQSMSIVFNARVPNG